MRRAKREHEEKESDRLEAMLRDPKKWWRLLRRKKVTSKKAQVDMSRVIDGEGKIREGDGARRVWKTHFEQLLNEGTAEVGGAEGNSGR